MKKPEIVYCNVIYEKSNGHVDNISTYELEEIIDALIEYDKMFHEGHKFSGSMARSVVEKGRKALIKAGVEL